MRRAGIQAAIVVVVLALIWLFSQAGPFWRQTKHGQGKEQVDWTDYVSEDGSYGISMPGQPKHVKEQVGFGAPFLTGNGAYVQSDFLSAQFYVVVLEASIQLEGNDAMLEITPMAISQETKGKLLTVGKIELDGHQGREILFIVSEGRGPYFQIARFFFVGKRQYTIGVKLRTQDQVTAPYVAKFFDSFRWR